MAYPRLTTEQLVARVATFEKKLADAESWLAFLLKQKVTTTEWPAVERWTVVPCKRSHFGQRTVSVDSAEMFVKEHRTELKKMNRELLKR